MARHMFLALLGSFALAVFVLAQDQSGFLSLDCGLPKDSSYIDVDTAIDYISDGAFIDTGISKNLSPEFDTTGLEKQLWYVRSFPQNIRNCYNIKLQSYTKYLIRARFMYGNYDAQGKVPQFELHLGANLWDIIRLDEASSVVTKEIIHISTMEYINVCFVNTGLGTPFISALELRLLNNDTYGTQSGSLLLFARWDLASTTNKTVRYGDDVYDRIWMPYNSDRWTKLSINPATFGSEFPNSYHPAATVMSTAATPANTSEPLVFSFDTADPISNFYLYMHFAELEMLQVNQSREFNISLNGNELILDVVPDYLYATTIYNVFPFSTGRYQVSINKTGNSTLPPILNAVEIYKEKMFLQSHTNQKDVEAIMKMKSTYGLKRNWQGDPCAPQEHVWDGLNCSYKGYDPPSIISLNLSSSGLTGKIAPSLINLTLIQYLDLSDNHLAGPVPGFLAKMQSLKVLNLTGNNLTGSIPIALLEKSKNGSVILSYDRNPYLFLTGRCQKKQKNKFIIPLVVSATALFILMIIIPLAIWWRLQRRKEKVSGDIRNDSLLEIKSRRFTYSDLLRITDNFKKILGKGGFGTVYHGCLDDTQVALKILSSSSGQGYKEFQAEVMLLTRAHHRNLTNLVGYCNERTHMGLIYEYMANGNLQHDLSDRNAIILSWENRLRIAMDAAQGLEYLHHGCKPPIVHRDIKSANILLNEKFEAKLADFGLTRMFPTENDTHLSTVVAGTPGYLDPEYYITNLLHERSDVYSFAVVLLEIFTCQPVIRKKENENTHITQWVTSILAKEDTKNVIDPCLEGEFEISSAKKAVELAVACASQTSTKRPTMSQVVTELKECLAMELARKSDGCSVETVNPDDIYNLSESGL